MGGLVLTAEHTHACALCGADIHCSVDGCRATGIRCPTCETALDDVASLPSVPRPFLTWAVSVEALEFATRRACDAMLTNPENATRVMVENLERLLPVDPTLDDADTWARLGVVIGGCDAWARRQHKHHGDCPSIRAMFCYNAAYALAQFVVNYIRNQEMKT